MTLPHETDREMTLHHFVPGLEQGEKYRIISSHHDVSGNWDGYRTWIVHYESTERESPECGTMIMYVAIGQYGEVGLWLRDSHEHSRLGVIKWIADLMAGGVCPDIIRSSIERGLTPMMEKIEDVTGI